MATLDTEPHRDEMIYIESKKHNLHFESQRSSLLPSHSTSMNTTVVLKEVKKPQTNADLLNNSQDSVSNIIKDF